MGFGLYDDRFRPDWRSERGLPRRMKWLTRRRQKADGTMPRGLRDDGRGRGRARRWSRTAKSVFSDSKVRCQFSKVPIHFDVSHDSHFKSQVSQRRLRRGYYARGKGYPRIRLLKGYAFERSRLAPNAKLGETCAATTRRYGIVVFRSPLRRNCVSPSSHPCNTPIVIYCRFLDAS